MCLYRALGKDMGGASCSPIALLRMFWLYSASERVIMHHPEYSVPLYLAFPQRWGARKITKSRE